MKIIKYWVLLLCCCVQAQAKVGRVLYYNKLNSAPSPIYLYANDKLLAEVDAKPEFGEDIEMGASDVAIELVLSPNRITEDQEIPAGLPSISVNHDWEKFLIIVIGAEGNELLPVELNVINAEDDDFGKSDFLFMNMSPNSIVGTFGEKVVELEPQEIQVEKMSEYSGQLLDVKLDYVRPNDNGKKRWMIYQGWRVLPDRRTVVLCYVPEGRTAMKYFATQVKNL